jgi:hypothetical protein
MALNFPDSPTTSPPTTFTGPGGVVWKWDGAKWVNGALTATSSLIVGLSNNTTDVVPVGTYDLGPVTNGGTVLAGYAHVVSGTLTYSAAIGPPGTYTPVTGISSVSSSSTTSDTVATATGANIIAAGQHLWCIISGTAPTGGTVFFTVKAP